MVSENCDFSTFRQVIEPSYIRLAKGVYILMNMTKVRASCPEGRHYNLTSQNCNPCIATVECGCELHVGNEVIAAEAQRCMREDVADSKLQHAVNLIVLQEFYELTNETLTGRKLFDPSEYREPQPLLWSMYSENTSRLIANDEKLSYSLKKLANSLRNDSVVLHSPSEALLFDYIMNSSLQQPFWYFNFWSWSTYAIFGLFIFAIFTMLLVYRMHRRLVMIQLLLVNSMKPLLPKTAAYELRTLATTMKTQVEQPEIFKELFESIRKLDIAVVTLVLLITIFLIIIGAIIKRRLARRSFLYLDIASDQAVVQIKLFEFPDASRIFAVKTLSQQMELSLKQLCGCGVLRIVSKRLHVYNTLTDETIKTPKHIFIHLIKWRSYERFFELHIV